MKLKMIQKDPTRARWREKTAQWMRAKLLDKEQQTASMLG